MKPEEVDSALGDVETSIKLARNAVNDEPTMTETKRCAWRAYRRLREVLGAIDPMGSE